MVRALLITLPALCLATPANAQAGASVTFFSQARLRGYSISAGHPVATLNLSYDDASGAYAAVSATAVAGSDELEPLSLQENVGFAKRLASGATVDFGIVNSNYTEYSSSGRSAGYTEVYAGLITHGFSSRISYSPNYFRHGVSTIYAEVDKAIQPAPKWHLDGHIGLLAHVGGPWPEYADHIQYDWRVGMARDVGRLSFHLDYTGGGPGHDYYDHRVHSRSAVVAGATLIL